MNLDLNVRVVLDLSPAFSEALADLARSLTGRSLPPLAAYKSPTPEAVAQLRQEFFSRADPAGPHATRIVSGEPFVREDTVAEEVSIEPRESVETTAEVEKSPPTPTPTPAPAPAPSPTPTVRPQTAEADVRWTADRNALLAAEYPVTPDLQALCFALNALPGLPISYDVMRWTANNRGLASPSRRGGRAKLPLPSKSTPATPAPAASAVPNTTDDATIRHWESQRGLCNGGEPLDIDRINAKRVDLGLLPFVRQNVLGRIAATMKPMREGGGL